MRFRGYDGYADDPDVYPPSEDSVLFIESLDIEPDMKVLEIGCGSGVVSIHAALEGARVTSVDINPRAVELTRKNAETIGARLEKIEQSDLFENVEGRFDMILFNLPYLPVEEGEVNGMISRSWAGGTDGMGPLPELVEKGPLYLEKGGKLIVVISSLMDSARLEEVLSGHPVRILGKECMFFEELRVLEIGFD